MKTHPILGIVIACATLSLPCMPADVLAQAAKKMTTQQVYEEALRAYYRGDLVEAERGLQKVIQVDPRHTTARGYLAQVTHKLKAREEEGGPGIEQNLAALIVPSVEFEDTPLQSALDFLSAKAAELTKDAFRPNFLYKGPTAELKEKKVTLKLTNVPMSVVVQYLGELTQTKFTYEKYAVVAVPARDTATAATPAEKKEGSDSLSPPR